MTINEMAALRHRIAKVTRDIVLLGCYILLAAPLIAQGPFLAKRYSYFQVTPQIPQAAYITNIATDSLGQCLGSYYVNVGSDVYPHYILVSGNTLDLTISPALLDANGLHNQRITLNGLNELDQYVGYSAAGVGVIWNKSGNSLSTLRVPGATATYPMAINLNGQIAGYFASNTQSYHGFIYDPVRGFSQVAVPPGPNVSVFLTAINRLGDVVGTYTNDDNYSDSGAFIYTHDGRLIYINAGQVVSESGQLTSFKPTSVQPLGINSAGEVVGKFQAGFFGGFRAFYYYNGVMEVLTPSGNDNTTSIASGISELGQVSGYLIAPNILFTGVAPSRGTTPWYSGVKGATLPSGVEAQGNSIRPGQVLQPGTSIYSSNGRYRFTYQGAGNLVLYRTADNKALWGSNSALTPAGVAIMGADGNLVVYNRFNTPVWAAVHTWPFPGSYFTLQDNGNGELRAPAGFLMFDTDTVQK